MSLALGGLVTGREYLRSPGSVTWVTRATAARPSKRSKVDPAPAPSVSGSLILSSMLGVRGPGIVDCERPRTVVRMYVAG